MPFPVPWVYSTPPPWGRLPGGPRHQVFWHALLWGWSSLWRGQHALVPGYTAVPGPEPCLGERHQGWSFVPSWHTLSWGCSHPCTRHPGAAVLPRREACLAACPRPSLLTSSARTPSPAHLSHRSNWLGTAVSCRESGSVRWLQAMPAGTHQECGWQQGGQRGLRRIYPSQPPWNALSFSHLSCRSDRPNTNIPEKVTLFPAVAPSVNHCGSGEHQGNDTWHLLSPQIPSPGETQ